MFRLASWAVWWSVCEVQQASQRATLEYYHSTQYLRPNHPARCAAHREHALVALGLLSCLLRRQQVREAAVDELGHEAVGLR